PVGSERPQPFRARLIAATNAPLDREVEAGRFRADLYYRLNVVGFSLPPLRDRPEVVPVLALKFLHEYAAGRRSVTGIAADALRALAVYAWPGNIRELRSVLERAVALCRGPEVQFSDLPEVVRAARPAAAPPAPPAPSARTGAAPTTL